MKCAIISCSNHKKKLFKKPYSLSYLNLPHSKEKIYIINLFYTCESFYALPSKKKLRLCKKICAEMNKNEIICVYLSGITDCAEFSDIKYKFYIPDGKNVLKSYASVGACVLAESKNLTTSDTKICIYQSRFDHIGFEIVSSFTKYFKNITIIGDNEVELEQTVKKIMELYGASISSTTSKSAINNCDFAFLLDEFVGIGVCENVTIIDLLKSFGSDCLNGAMFSLPKEFDCLLPYFNMFDDICLEFILRLNDEKIRNSKNICEAISAFNGSFKKFLKTTKKHT